MINGISANVASLNANNFKDEEKKIVSQKERDIQDITAQNKVAQIKESIANKDYKIDLHKTSEKMALDLLNL